jgi:flagellar biosynthesis protein FlhF
MTQHKVIAEDSLSAMDEISRVLGKDAVILDTKKINGKIEIIGSNNIEDVASSNAKRKSLNKKSNFTHLFSNHSLEQSITNKKLNSVSENISNIETLNSNISEVQTNNYVDINTFNNFTNKIENLLKTMIISDMDDFNSGNHSSMTINLLKKGYSKNIISEFKNIIDKEIDLDPELVFYQCLAKKLVLPSEQNVLNANIIFINGSSGSGKTTLSSKIASHILDNKFIGNERHKLSIIDFAPKSSNHSELINFGRLLNLNVSSISTLEEIKKFIEANKNDRKLIIDVSQENKHIEGYTEYLKELCMNEKFVNILALQSGNNKLSMKSQIDFYKESDPIIGLTKLDESYVGPEELSILGELNCKIGMLSGSRSIIGSLAFAKKEVLAQYMKDMSI